MSWSSNDYFPHRMSGLVAPIYYPQPEAMQAMEVDTSTAPGMDAKSSSRSCTTCSKAKAKCVKRPGQQICERCSRLRKECHSREPVLRRRKVVKTTRAAQLEKLENKIEHLVNALATTQSHRGFSVDLGQPSPPISQTSERTADRTDKLYNDQRLLEDASNPRQQAVLNSLCDAIDGMQEDVSESASSSGSPDPTSAKDGPPAPVSPYADYQSVGVSMAEAEVLLDRYRRLMASAMPFVVLPPNATAQQLYAEKPTLLHAIVVVASFNDLPRQQANVKRLTRNLSERIMINCEKSVDILQAILVFVGWYHPHIFWSNQCTNLIHLAIAMIIDLGFDRPPQQCGDFKKESTKAVHGVASMSERVPQPEEHRILAGTFYLSSLLSSSFKKIDAMPWTNFLSNALVSLEAAAAHDSDLFLVQIVRLQHLIEETSNIGTPQAPLQMYTKAFNADLDRLRKADPTRDPNNTFLQLQYHVTEVLIWEIALNDLQENKDTTLLSRLEDLCRLIDAIKGFLDLYFTIPADQYLTMPFAVFAQFAHTFIVLIKIASLEVDGWDFSILSNRLDFIETVEHAAVRYEQSMTAKVDGLDVNNDHFGKWSTRIRWMKQVYETKFTQGEDKCESMKQAMMRTPAASEEQFAADTPATTATSGGAQQPTPPDDILSGDFFNYLDENFWQSFAGDFDLGFPEVNMG